MDLDSSVSYQVSDSLRHRHAYSCQQAEGKPGRGKGAGFGFWGVEDGIRVLSDDSDSADKEEALAHLLKQLASCELVSRLVGGGLIPGLNAVSSPPCRFSAKCDELACLSFRQIAMVPAGAVALYNKGSVEVMVAVLDAKGTTDDAARVAACNALRQVAFSWVGRGLLLGEKLPEGVTTKVPPRAGSDEDADRLAKGVVAALAKNLTEDGPALRTSAVKCLELLTTFEKGLQIALCDSVFQFLNQTLEKIVAAEDWSYDASTVAYVEHALNVIWNIALDDFGKVMSTEVNLMPKTLGLLLFHVAKFPTKLLKVKAAVTGAVAALFVKAETKRAGVVSLFDPPRVQCPAGTHVDIRYLLVKLLKAANAMYEPIVAARKAGEPVASVTEHGDDVQDIPRIITNCNHAIRLLADLPAARALIQQQLAPEPFVLRRQIFYGTQFESEFIKKNESAG
ncbi:hypothetical protein DIPPA_02858 [Diplonema papillatum]|nr:hypothetical protein DIPPA_02858 [Diplonema papillatum]